MTPKIWDWVVIGAGLGGLMTACLLKHRFPEQTVLILESHTDIGGCAGCFERSILLPGFEQKQRVRFDVGATTLSALGEGQTISRLLSELGISLPATQADPGVRVVLGDRTVINRYADRDQWYAESTKHFGPESLKLWEALEPIERSSWSLLPKFPRFPPASVGDVFSLLRPQALLGLSALRNMQRPFSVLLTDIGLHENEKLRAFMDQLLLVSTQTTSSDVSVLGAAFGLIYPSQTYYLDGGAYTLSSELLKHYLALGGEIKFKQRVASIQQHKGFEITTSKQISYQAQRIVSNATLWGTAAMIDGAKEEHSYFRKWDSVKTGENVWGANTYYAIVDESVGGSALYHQLHHDKSALFVSLSRVGDTLKAPAGYRTLTASIHEPDPDHWFTLSKEQSERELMKLQTRIEGLLDEKLEGFATSAKHSAMVGTPRTFQFYTQRRSGLVGGVAYKAGLLPWHWPSPVSPINGLYLVGDTIFPGQSAGAVAQCALSLVGRL